MTPERAREILPIIQAHAEGKQVYLVIHNTLGETVYHKCGRNIRFDHGAYVLEIPVRPERTEKELAIQNACDAIDSLVDYAEYSYRDYENQYHGKETPEFLRCYQQDKKNAQNAGDELRKQFNYPRD